MSHPEIGEHALADVIDPERFSREALQPLYQINRALIELLVRSASQPASEAHPQIVLSLGPTLLELETATREQLARCPTALVDFGVRNLELWQQIEKGLPVLPSLQPCFPRFQAIQLAQGTLTLAWTLWQSSREAATLIFGLSPECAAILSRIGVQAIPRIAEDYPHCVRPRWETETTFWRQLIRAAEAMDSPAQTRQPPPGIYAMQRQLADLIVLSPSPATRATAATRANQR